MCGIARVSDYMRINLSAFEDPLNVDVANVQLIDWIGSKLKDKFIYWKSQLWPFHVRLKLVQCILISMLLYFVNNYVIK